MQTGRRAQQFSAGAPSTDRGRGRGRGRGVPFPQGSPNNANHGLPTTDTSRGSGTGRPFRGSRGTTRGRASDRPQGNASKRFNSPDTHSTMRPGQPALPILPINPPQDQIKPVDHEVLEARRAKLNEQYERYRQSAVERGLMSDDKQSSLDDAIKTVGTCTQMCDEKERVNRIFENQVDAAERLPCPETGRSVPIEGRMVKKFRRSAAGVDKQIPEELRTPRTLKKTLDYLFDEIVGKNRLGKHHKFVWDRTRAIRNDFSIQSLARPEDIKYEVDCYERIVRFHILSAHQLSNAENLAHDEHFEHQQELEQLQKTFQSLMDKYDAFRGSVKFPNEAEFRAFYIIFSPILFSFDTEVQIQQWPKHVLNDGRVQTALKLYAAMGNTHRSVGSKNLEPVPVAVAQANSGFFWELIASQRVGYLMACVAEMSFQNVRFTALNALWSCAKGAPEKAQANMRTWTKAALTEYLCYDIEDETEALCERVGIAFSTSSSGQEYLDFRSNPSSRLENPFSKPEQIFCEDMVESKRYGRTLVAVMNGMSVAEARRAGMVEEEYDPTPLPQSASKRNTMFVGDDDNEDEAQDEQQQHAVAQQSSASAFNPAAAVFSPGSAFASNPSADRQPKWMTSFGKAEDRSPDSTGGPPKGLFGPKTTQQEQASTVPFASSQSPFATGLGTTNTPFNQPLSTSAIQAPAPARLSGFSGFTSGQPSAQPSFFSRTSPAAPDEQNFPEATTQSASRSSIFDVSSQNDAIGLGVPKTTPTFSRSSTTGTKPATEHLEPSQPVFNFTPSSSSASLPATTTSAPAVPSSNLQPAATQASKPFSFSFASTTSASPSQSTEPTVPQFSFLKPAAPASSEAAATPPASTTPTPTPTQTESQTITKRPSIGEFSFLPVQNQPAPLANTTFASSSPARALAAPRASASPSRAQPSPSQDQTQSLSSTVSSSVVHDQSRPQQIDEENLLEQLCRIGLVQKDGILDMFVSYKVSNLVKEVFKTFQDQRFAEQTTALKANVLRRKFFLLWKSRADQKRLSRRAERRRSRLAASIRAANDKKRREEAELVEIHEAQVFRKQLQENQRRRNEEAEQKRREKIAHPQAHSMAMKPPGTNPTQQAGQKRKMLANSTSQSNMQGITMAPMHKRSKTLGTPGNSDVLRATNSLPARSPRASLAGSTNLRRSVSQKSLRQSLTQQRLDQTQTDYFTLKAHGLDPDTPLVPETAAQLAARKQREDDYRQSVDDRVSRRLNSTSGRSRSRSSTQSSPSQSITSIPPPLSILQNKSMPQPAPVTSSTTSLADEDPFLKQLREARQALTTDEAWFKTHTSELEQEIGQQELRRSLGSRSNTSQDQSFALSANGFARSISGYEYVPPELKPGQTLSRTEERIRRTGARGLANKPIGGAPKPVAMSRRSAQQLHHAQAAAHGRKRSIGEVDPINGNTIGIDDYQQQSATQLAQHATGKKAQPNGVTLKALEALQRSSPFNPFDAGGLDDEPEDEGEETEAYDDGVDQEDIFQAQYNGGVAYLKDDEADTEASGEYEDEDEEEVYEENGEEENGHYPDLQAYDYGEEEEEEEEEEFEVDEDGIPLPPRGKSAATSTPDTGTGAGSTVDAAIELSD